jgi:CheY-like chemotaxis protein
MAGKRALVVDDSKSARVILSRMLEKYAIEVDMAESAEHAIDYLKHNRPDAIFMDHLMPGMDGLQAVRAIKGDPQTAMIPIMMYTSQEGELYVSQARALGAMGVLPKQVRPVDVSKVLYELHLLPERREAPEIKPPLQPQPDAGGIVSAAPPIPDWGRRLDQSLKDQAVDLRRFVVASLDSFAGRIVSDVRDVLPAPTAPAPAPLPMSEPAPAPPAVWPWLTALAAVCSLALLLAVLWTRAREDGTEASAAAASLRAENAALKRSSQNLEETVRDLTSVLSAPVATYSAAPAVAPGLGSAAVPGVAPAATGSASSMALGSGAAAGSGSSTAASPGSSAAAGINAPSSSAQSLGGTEPVH